MGRYGKPVTWLHGDGGIVGATMSSLTCDLDPSKASTANISFCVIGNDVAGANLEMDRAHKLGQYISINVLQHLG